MTLYKPSELVFSSSKLFFSSKKIYVSPLDVSFKYVLVISFLVSWMISLESLDVASVFDTLPFHFLKVLISGISYLLVDLLLFSQNSVVYSFYQISIPELIPIGSDLRVIWAALLKLNRLCLWHLKPILLRDLRMVLVSQDYLRSTHSIISAIIFRIIFRQILIINWWLQKLSLSKRWKELASIDVQIVFFSRLYAHHRAFNL